MKAITSIDHYAARFDFPEISERLRELTLHYLHQRTVRDRGRSRQEDKPFKTRSECEAKAEEITRKLTEELTPRASIDFQRTLRIPDDGKNYPLPPGLGRFPLKHVDDFADRLPAGWRERGGAVLPLHQSEALWLHFSADYPIALKVGTGKVCAISGKRWREGISSAPQNYCALPHQPWLDGYAVAKGIIRQFIAEPLGSGFTIEEQLTGRGEWGGIQLQAYPLDPKIYWKERIRDRADALWHDWIHPRKILLAAARGFGDYGKSTVCCSRTESSTADMGLAAGGRMKQEIYADHHAPSDYVECTGNRCYIHLCNSAQWELITGDAPPDSPPSARDYSRHGLPWFDYYDEKQTALPGGENLKDIKSVKQLESETGKKVLPPLPDEAKPKVIIKYIKE